MKKLILTFIFFPSAMRPGFKSIYSSSEVMLEVRSGKWPINLKKTNDIPHVTYLLEFRDEHVPTSTLLDTLPFKDLAQLKYFGEGLSALKKGNNGDIAKFKDYSVKRSESKKDGLWYILTYQWGLSNFQQREADTLISTIKKL
jgi:hypothetical protein